VTPAVKAWVSARIRKFGLASKPTLEVGSLDVNGSVRGLFMGSYTGVDFRDGPGVDIVMNGHALTFPDRSFDVVVSTEMLEHDDAFWLSMAEMGRVLRPGGHLLLTTRGNGFKRHGHPFDYWRFMPDSGALLMGLAGCHLLESVADPRDPGIFVHGRM
jgi:SAM-dependent methyltransferase